jgi:hypothetical protein
MKGSFWIAVLALSTILFVGQQAPSQDKQSQVEQTLLQLANRDRAALGLAPLKWSAPLAAAAHQHAVRMAQQNTLSHQLPGEAGLAERASQSGARFSTIAENIAEGPSAESIHQQWMNSPPHRANLLDPQLDAVGIAAENRNGTLFAVEDLSLAVVRLTLPEQEGIVGDELRKRGLLLLDSGTDARRSCLLDNGYAGNHTPSFVLHYATTDLQSLPGMLEQRIQTGKYHSAVVGACPNTGKTGFSAYRVAVLLYE